MNFIKNAFLIIMLWLTLQDVKSLEKVSSNTDPDFITRKDYQ